MSHIFDEFKIRGGRILIYRRVDGGNNWHCRIKFPNQPYVRQSLKTSVKKEATELATTLFDELNYKNKRGLAVTNRKFNSIVSSYFKAMEKLVERGAMRAGEQRDSTLVINRYFKSYFGKKNINKITDSDIAKYKDWRRDYWTTGEGAKLKYIEYERGGKIIRSPKPKSKPPAASRLNREYTTLRKIFEHAKTHGFITAEEMPVIKNEKVTINRRADFSLQDYRRLIRVSMWRYKKAKDDKRRFQRQMLHDYILFMGNSGCRPIEAATMRWKDIVTFSVKDKEGITEVYLKISVRGKGKKRDLVPMQRIKGYLDRIKQVQEERAKYIGRKIKLDDYVFADDNGKQIQSFKKGFNELLKAAGLEYDNHSSKRSIYSLRHTYATFRLIYGGVNVYELAQNMGTSVEMIEKHYGHMQPEQVAERLTRYVM